MIRCALVALPLALLGCKGGGGAASQEGTSLFKTRCGTCHGEDGKGNGPASAALNPKPRNFSDGEWQKSVTDEQIKKVIVGGGPAVGKNAAMPPAPDLEGKPDLDALVKVVRSFK